MREFPDLGESVSALISAEGLPGHFADIVSRYYRPLAEAIAARSSGGTLVIGVNGAQGTGKSTLSRFLTLLLSERHHLPALAFSLDDLYLTKGEREALSHKVHPMLAVRGVPGTHDVELGLSVITALMRASPDQVTAIPSFDKARDDRAPKHAWPVFRGRPAVIILEGWCVGANPERESELNLPVNDLERVSDRDGRWRRYVNQQLADNYSRLFDLFDLLVMIAAPNWEVVYRWRELQEEKLRERCRQEGLDDSGVMSPEQVASFIQYYERITRHCLVEMPGRADVVFEMDDQHQIVRMSGPDIE